MASKSTKAKPETTAAPDARPALPKFSIPKLRESCRQLFGVSTSTFDGATYGLTGKFTVDEIKTHIEAWAKEGVK